MSPVLIIEIVSALIAFGALLVLMAQTIRLDRGGKGGHAGRIDRLRRRHRSSGFVLLAAAAIHGAAATAYASGARPETYVIGWASLAMFALSDICMAPSIRSRLAHATGAHVACFTLGVLLFILHAVLGRL